MTAEQPVQRNQRFSPSGQPWRETQTTPQPARRAVLALLAVLALTFAFASCLLIPRQNACADEVGNPSAAVTISASEADPKLADGKDEQDPEQQEKDDERKTKEEEAAQKRSDAEALLAQSGAMQESFAAAQAERDEAQRSLDEAIALRDDASVRLEQETARLESLNAELADFIVKMYKQGGVTPYLDVMLRATSYREFLTSWNMTMMVSEYGEALASEEHEIREAIEAELTTYDEQISQAERAMATAEAKSNQIEATRLALVVQACNFNVEAARILEDEEAIAQAEAAANDAQRALDEAIAGGLAGESSLVGTGIFAYPCPGSIISSGFGFRTFDNSFHKGLDMASPQGTPYYAAESGTVIAATNGGGDNGGAGNWIVIDHGDGLVTKYMHSLVTLVNVGDHVERGQNIGLVGTTGNSTGPHLHFQVEANGVAVDPTSFL